MTPEQEEQVSRALAAAARRNETPTLPPDVAARLDGVLAELAGPRAAAAAGDLVSPATGNPAGDRAGGPAGATAGVTAGGTAADGGRRVAGNAAGDGAGGDELAARRRRRWPNALVAAAALTVIALAGGAVATGGFGMSGGGTATDSAGVAKEGTADGGTSGSTAPSGPNGTPEPARPSGAQGLAVPELRTASLARDVRRALDSSAASAAGGKALTQDQGPATGPSTSPTGRTRCARPLLRRGDQRLVVRLDGRPATLVLGAPDGGTRVARVYSCADPGAPVARTTVRDR